MWARSLKQLDLNKYVPFPSLAFMMGEPFCQKSHEREPLSRTLGVSKDANGVKLIAGRQ